MAPYSPTTYGSLNVDPCSPINITVDEPEKQNLESEQDDTIGTLENKANSTVFGEIEPPSTPFRALGIVIHLRSNTCIY